MKTKHSILAWEQSHQSLVKYKSVFTELKSQICGLPPLLIFEQLLPDSESSLPTTPTLLETHPCVFCRDLGSDTGVDWGHITTFYLLMMLQRTALSGCWSLAAYVEECMCHNFVRLQWGCWAACRNKKSGLTPESTLTSIKTSKFTFECSFKKWTHVDKYRLVKS